MHRVKRGKASTQSSPNNVPLLPLPSIPPSFRDAILITRRTGYQYLWIDSLLVSVLFKTLQSIGRTSLQGCNLVGDFVSCELSDESNRFLAILGIAREVHDLTGLIYKAGMWLEDIDIGLLWETYGHGGASKREPDEPPQRALSWSWASVEHGARYPNPPPLGFRSPRGVGMVLL
jgi:hypothetical protein